jgi:hypothetical protein
MAGPGIYFTTCAPWAPLDGNGPQWPSEAFRDALLRKSFGNAWEEAAKMGKVDAVIVCRFS